nr:hypothetical protein [Valsa mali var. pyri (nom. inval.)]
MNNLWLTIKSELVVCLIAVKLYLFVEYSKKVLWCFLFAIESGSVVFLWDMFLGLYHIVLYRQESIKRVSLFDSLIGGIRPFNLVVSVRLFSTSVHTKSSSFISPDFLTGFSDAESCFSLSIPLRGFPTGNP